MTEQLERPKQIDQMEILNKEDRTFKSWGTVEVRDREGDLLPMDEFRKIMPVIMKRGGNITDRHSNRTVAKILNYEFKIKETPEGPREGILITGHVFKDYDLDDMVWEGIKTGIYKGLSFGGRNKDKDITFEKGKMTSILKDLEGFEFALVPAMGNQEATMEEINYLAKGIKKAYEADGKHVHDGETILGEHTHPEIEKFMAEMFDQLMKLSSDVHEIKNSEDELLFTKEEVKKPFAGFDSFDACKKMQMDDGKSEESANKICGFLQAKAENKEKEAKKQGENYLKKSDVDKNMEVDEIKKQNEAIQKNSESIEKINENLSEITALLKVKKEDEDDKKPKEEDEDKDKVKKEEHEDKKKPKEDEVEKEEKVTLPKSPEEEIEEDSPASNAETDDVNFVEKKVAQEVKKQLSSMINKSASTPSPMAGLQNTENIKVPKNTIEVKNLIQKIRNIQ